MLKFFYCNDPRIIFVSGGLEPLQMISELDTGQCASKEAKPRRGVDMRWSANKEAESPEREWTRGGVPARTLVLKGVDWGISH